MVVALRRTRPETLVDLVALLIGAAAVAFYTLMFVTPEVASESRPGPVFVKTP
jgi:hypothetical protein